MADAPPNAKSEKLAYTIAEAVRALGIGRSTIYWHSHPAGFRRANAVPAR